MPDPMAAVRRAADAVRKLHADLPPRDLHPGLFIRDELLPEYGLTNVAELSRLLDVNRPNLVSVLAGRTSVSRQLAYKLGALTEDAVADFLIAYQNAYDIGRERGERECYRRTIGRRPPVRA